MHEFKLVHMHVKADNVFLEGDCTWDLGDFGSARKVGDRIWSYTKEFNPYAIPDDATVIPALDYVLLGVMIAVELKKDQWKDLCGKKQNVQVNLVMERLSSIEDNAFKKEVVELFEDNLQIVTEHLKD